MRTILSICLCLAFCITLPAQNFKFGKVSDEEVKQTQHPIDPTANAAILYREVKSNFQYNQDSGWILLTHYYERIKIYNKEGVDWANRTIRQYKGKGEDKVVGLKGNTYNLEGGKVSRVKLRNDGIFKEETSKYLNQTKIALPDVREGSVIEFEYTIQSPFITSIDEWKLQETIPIDKVFLEFKAPEYFAYQPYQRGGIHFTLGKDSGIKRITLDMGGSAQIESRNNQQSRFREVEVKENITTVEIADVPPLKEESYAGNIENYGAAIQFELSYVDMPGSTIKNYTNTWEDVSKRVFKDDSFGTEIGRTGYFEKDIDAVLEGAIQPIEKAARILTFVSQKMNWNGFNGFTTNEGVRNAYKKGTGNIADINLMLTAMLRYARLDADPVLVSTKAHGIPLFPTFNGFNYVVAHVNLPEGSFLLDASTKNAELGVLASKVINGYGRLIKNEGASAWVTMHPQQAAMKNTMLTLELQPDLSFSGKSQNRFTGNYAMQYREIFKNADPVTQQTKIRNIFNQADLNEFKFENLNLPGLPVVLEFDFSAQNAEEVAGKIYLSPLSYLATIENPFKTENREFPIDFGHPMKNRALISITIPEGYRIESIPENSAFQLDNNIGSYRYLINQNGNQLQLSVELSINEAFIAATEYGSLKKFFEMMVAKESEKIVLTRV